MPVTMPTTRPPMSTSGPPELPGFTAASNWIMSVQHLAGLFDHEAAVQGADDAGG